jgi:hypothetical protein
MRRYFMYQWKFTLDIDEISPHLHWAYQRRRWPVVIILKIVQCQFNHRVSCARHRRGEGATLSGPGGGKVTGPGLGNPDRPSCAPRKMKRRGSEMEILFQNGLAGWRSLYCAARCAIDLRNVRKRRALQSAVRLGGIVRSTRNRSGLKSLNF